MYIFFVLLPQVRLDFPRMRAVQVVRLVSSPRRAAQPPSAALIWEAQMFCWLASGEHYFGLSELVYCLWSLLARSSRSLAAGQLGAVRLLFWVFCAFAPIHRNHSSYKSNIRVGVFHKKISWIFKQHATGFGSGLWYQFDLSMPSDIYQLEIEVHQPDNEIEEGQRFWLRGLRFRATVVGVVTSQGEPGNKL